MPSNHLEQHRDEGVAWPGRSGKPAWRHVLTGAVCLMGWQMPCAVAAPPQLTVAAVKQLIVEQGCFGCTRGRRVVLSADGRAQLICTGMARHGTEDVTAEARLAAGRFQTLLRTAQQALASWSDRSTPPETADGAWLTLTLQAADGHTLQAGHAGNAPEERSLAQQALLQAMASALPRQHCPGAPD